jgi:hypothetical protein
VIETGFNIFMLLMEMKRYFPDEKDLQDIDMNGRAMA